MRKYSDSNYFQNNGQDVDRPALKYYFKVFRRYLKCGQVLDYGCGVGFLSKRLATIYDTMAYDVSDYSRQTTKINSPKTKVVDSESEIKSDSLNGIICLHTLEHIKNPGSTLKKMSGWLKKGGMFLMVVPNPGGWGHKIKKSKWFGFRDNTHVSILTANEWGNLVQASGFQITKTAGDGFWDVPYLPWLPCWLQKLIFFPTCLGLVLSGRLLYSKYFGECLILMAKRV